MVIAAAILNFIISVLVLFLIAYLIEKFILPLIPAKWLKWIFGALALLAVIYLIERFFGLHL